MTAEGDGAPITLLSGKGKYQRLTWDEDNTQLAFTSDKEDAEAKQPKFRVYHWNRKDPQATEDRLDHVTRLSQRVRRQRTRQSQFLARRQSSVPRHRAAAGTGKKSDEEIPG